MILDKGQLLETEQMFRDAGEQWPVIIPNPRRRSAKQPLVLRLAMHEESSSRRKVDDDVFCELVVFRSVFNFMIDGDL